MGNVQLHLCESSAVFRKGDVGLYRSELSEMGKFERTGQLGILQEKERKRFSSAVIEEIATAIMESSIKSLHGTPSVPTILRNLDMQYSTVPHIMSRILYFYSHKIQAVQQVG